MMTEAQAIAAKLEISFRVPMEKRIAGAEAVGEHKTSMLQDVEAGRTLEVEAVIGSIAVLGRLTQTPCPAIDAIYACTRLLDRGIQHAAQATPTANRIGSCPSLVKSDEP
jgi:2-dehydropantoate 2-reductase